MTRLSIWINAIELNGWNRLRLHVNCLHWAAAGRKSAASGLTLPSAFFKVLEKPKFTQLHFYSWGYICIFFRINYRRQKCDCLIRTPMTSAVSIFKNLYTIIEWYKLFRDTLIIQDRKINFFAKKIRVHPSLYFGDWLDTALIVWFGSRIFLIFFSVKSSWEEDV